MGNIKIIRLKNQAKAYRKLERKIIKIVIEMAQHSMSPDHYENFENAIIYMCENRQITTKKLF